MNVFRGERGTCFHYDLDFLGNVVISDGKQVIEIPADDVLQFVTVCFIKQNDIVNIQSCPWREYINHNGESDTST